jgi:phosphoribosyl 1,2-cyclic phosphodiesterase
LNSPKPLTGKNLADLFDGCCCICDYQPAAHVVRNGSWKTVRGEPGRQSSEGIGITLRVTILASGSSGNATLVETGQSCLLLDAGIGRREILRRFETLGRPPAHVDAIVISHEHSDHSGGLPQLLREWNSVAWLTEDAHREFLRALPENTAKKFGGRVEHFRAGERFMVGDLEITPFAVPHDAADPVGFTVRANGAKLAIVTDLGYLPELVKQHLRESDCLILESNHDLDMLKVGPYPWFVKQRVMSRTGHLSNHVVGEFLADPESFDGRARYLVLAHISENNNNPHLVRLCAEEALGRRPAEAAFRGQLFITSQRVPLASFEL